MVPATPIGWKLRKLYVQAVDPLVVADWKYEPDRKRPRSLPSISSRYRSSSKAETPFIAHQARSSVAKASFAIRSPSAGKTRSWMKF